MARFRKNIKCFLLSVRTPQAEPQEGPGQQGGDLAVAGRAGHEFWIWSVQQRQAPRRKSGRSSAGTRSAAPLHVVTKAQG